ncbi:hypothetical protein ACHWQZ_G002191 [Mnemiopsis leidyi]
MRSDLKILRNDSVFQLYKNHEALIGNHINTETERPLWITFFLFLTISGLLGNTVILLASTRKVIKLDKITTTLIFHVAVLDLTNTIFFIFPTFLTVATDHWMFGDKFCYFQVFTRTPFIYCSMLLVCALNCSKLASVLLPFHSSTWRGRHGHFTAGFVWFISAGSILLYVTGSYTIIFFFPLMSCGVIVDNYEVNMIVETVIMMVSSATVVGTTICLIAIAIRMNSQRGRSANLQGIVTVISIATVYCVSFLPTVVFSATQLMVYNGVLKETKWFVKIVSNNAAVMRLLIYLNNVSNAVIYYASVVSFRDWVRSRLLGVRRWNERERWNEYFRQLQRGNNRVIPVRGRSVREDLGDMARRDVFMLRELGVATRNLLHSEERRTSTLSQSL